MRWDELFKLPQKNEPKHRDGELVFPRRSVSLRGKVQKTDEHGPERPSILDSMLGL